MVENLHSHDTCSGDKYELYTLALQTPQLEAQHLASLGCGHHLREDFCGTGAISRNWVALSENHRAIAVDIDRQALACGRVSAAHQLPYDGNQRIEFTHADATTYLSHRVDIVCIPNSSIFLITDREHLKQYLDAISHSLNRGGAIAIDMFGGPGASGNGTTVMDNGRFTCIWDQNNFDYSTNEFDARIHFERYDGPDICDAFSYRMRLWSTAELIDLLAETGFTDACATFSATRSHLFQGHGQNNLTEIPGDEWEISVIGRK